MAKRKKAGRKENRRYWEGVSQGEGTRFERGVEKKSHEGRALLSEEHPLEASKQPPGDDLPTVQKKSPKLARRPADNNKKSAPKA